MVWFADTYCALPANDATTEYVRKTIRDSMLSLESVSQADGVDFFDTRQLAAHFFDGDEQRVMPALARVVRDFQQYREDLTAAMQPLPVGDAAIAAFQRAATLSPHLNHNVDFFRNSRRTRNEGSDALSVDQVVAALRSSKSTEERRRTLETEHVFAWMCPPIGVVASCGVQPLLPHEAVFMASDPCAMHRVRAFYELLLPCFGLRSIDPLSGTAERDDARCGAAFAWMCSVHNIDRMVVRIIKFTSAVGLEQHGTNFVDGLLEVPQVSETFREALENKWLPALSRQGRDAIKRNHAL